MEVAILEGRAARAQPLLDGGSVVTMVTSEFVKQYGLKAYLCAPEKLLAINGQALMTESKSDFRM